GQGQATPKVYAAEYSRPALDPDSLLNSNQQTGGAQAAPVMSTSPGQPVTHQQTTPQAQASPTMQPPTPTPAAQTPEAPPGVNPALWATMSDQQRQAVLAGVRVGAQFPRSEEHTSELQSREKLVCRLLLEKKKTTQENIARLEV